ncbi:hypothetical protein G6K91_11030 [Agrobacterium rhizogenes]|nr:hypothetical protein [Rhizobium rhizogenes]NTG54041.1 hypothetical protein [Rhizobium rhizogenes]
MACSSMYALAMILAIGSAANAVAASNDSVGVVARQMIKCLKLPADAPASYSIGAVVVLKDGVADLVSVNFPTQPSDWEKAAAPLVADAITACEPYNSISGRIELSVTPELIKAGSKN